MTVTRLDTGSDPIRLLMIAFDGGRWGPARLVKPLGEAGFQVGCLCPSDNPLARTRYAGDHFPLPPARASTRFEQRLAEVMKAFAPRLIVPCDERVVACLHAILRRVEAGGRTPLGETALAIVKASLGDPDRFDETLLKSCTQRLALKIGVPVPPGASVTCQAGAVAEAGRIGYPVYVKSSFSWSGAGVRLCLDDADVGAAMTAALSGRGTRLREHLRRLAHRDWHPNDAPIDVQKAIAGKPAMTCAIAVDGRTLAVFSAETQRTSVPNGPSSVVRLGRHAEMERISVEMIRALGATGFIGLDFMIETATGAPFLLECNPRPTPTCHLGPRIGVDLCAALAADLRGAAYVPPETAAQRQSCVALFPDEWRRDAASAAASGEYLDIPLDDPPLLRAMIGLQ